jgi:hypothetical protein
MSPVWHTKVEGLLAPMEAYEDDLDLEKVKAAVVKAIKDALDWTEGDDPELDDLLEHLEAAPTEDAYNSAWADMYDWADRERVWLDTMP